jgi:sugar lactone lactonase YvrE
MLFLKNRILRYITLIFFSVVFNFCQKKNNYSNDTNIIYKEAVNAFQKKQYKLALEGFLEIDKQLPNRPEILEYIARGYALSNDVKNSLIYIKKLIPINADTSFVSDIDFESIKESEDFLDIITKIIRLQRPVNKSHKFLTLYERDLHIESVAYDSLTKTFYFGSIHKRKIISFRDTSLKTFSKPSDDLWAVFGLKADSKRRALWVCTNPIQEMDNYNPGNRRYTAAVFKYDLDKGTLIRKYFLDKDSLHHLFGDLTVLSNGDVYITDSYYPAIYSITQSKNKLTMFVKNQEFSSLQGICASEDNKFLFISDYNSGIYKIELENIFNYKKVVDHPEISTIGTDGLYFYKNNLIAIQNGTNPIRVVKYRLSKQSDSIFSYDFIENVNPFLNEPTLGTIINNKLFYIANSQWNSYDKGGKIFTNNKLKDIYIMEAPID